MTAITYRMSQDFIIKSDKMSAEEKEKFLGLNAAKFYGFEVKENLPYISHMAE
jgi:predicted TIM-barrel fold metal-dependent hydrolase